MNLAIVCSWLNQYGGAERVLEVLHDMYPAAPVYTSLYRPEALPDAYRTWDIRVSFLDRLPSARKRPQFYLPLFPRAFESLNLRGYDTILSVTSAFAHGVIPPAGARHICYCLTPARFLWNTAAYMEREAVSAPARLALRPFLGALRRWDARAAQRVTEFIAISRTVQERIKATYGRESRLIYPPVNTALQVGEQEAQAAALPAKAGTPAHYLIVSRLVPYKRIDLAVQAFTRLGLPLRIIGGGRDRAALEAMAGPTVAFLGYVADDAAVRAQMAACRAFIFPGEEDFGISPVEAMSVGRPVIALAAGGALDTIVEGTTGVFFCEPTVEALMDAVRRFERMTWDAEAIRAAAQPYGVERFRREMAEMVEGSGL